MSGPGLDYLEVAGKRYSKRHYAKGGHGWVRDVGNYKGVDPARVRRPHRAEVGTELLYALDRIEELEIQLGATET